MPDRPTPDPVALAALLERVRAATGPDRELDARIYAETEGRDIIVKNSATWSGALFGRYREPPHDECFLWSPIGGWAGLPDLTRSIDAADALVVRIMPSHRAGYQPCIGGSYRGHVIRVTDTSTTLVTSIRAATAPLAVLSCLLTALLHQSEASHAE